MVPAKCAQGIYFHDACNFRGLQEDACRSYGMRGEEGLRGGARWQLSPSFPVDVRLLAGFLLVGAGAYYGYLQQSKEAPEPPPALVLEGRALLLSLTTPAPPAWELCSVLLCPRNIACSA